MSTTFTKLFSSITESTVWCESSDVRIVWIAMLAMADRHGRVFGTIPGLANRARVPVSACREAVKRFMEPDEDSRTKEHEGRRIREIDGGWVLLNHGKYRSIRDEEERLAYKAQKERERRARIAKEERKRGLEDGQKPPRQESTTPEKEGRNRGQKRGQNGQTCTGVDSNGHNADADTEAEAVVAGTNTLNSPNSTGNTQTASSPRSAAEQPVVEPPPSGVRVVPMNFKFTPEQHDLIDLVLVASPPGIVAGLTTGVITPVERALVIGAVKREAQEHRVSHGEALNGLLAAVQHQTASIPLDRLNLLGGMDKYFNKAKYRTDPVHVQERAHGKPKGRQVTDAARAVIADLRRARGDGALGDGTSQGSGTIGRVLAGLRQGAV